MSEPDGFTMDRINTVKALIQKARELGVDSTEMTEFENGFIALTQSHIIVQVRLAIGRIMRL
jgi:hypothetical protein